jgi:tetratricopeptide (TPR) repeat protein
MTLSPRIPGLLAAALAALVVFGATALVLSRTRGEAPAAASAAAPAPRTTDGTIAAAQARLAEEPGDVRALTALAGASLDKGRQTGDPTWNTRAEEAARNALERDPASFEAMDALGTLALTRHRFAEALDWSRRSLATAPGRVAPLGIRADALIELGRYEAGVAAIQRRLDLRPDLPAYSRASYALELRGDRPGAISLMELAVGAGAPGSEAQTWARVQLGLLRAGGGDLDGAEREMRTALAALPGDARATAGLAHVLASRGRLERAAALYSQAIDRLPLPEYPAALADIHRALGRDAAVRDDLALAAAMQGLLASNGSLVDLDLSLQNADARRPDAAAVAAARAARRARPGVIGDQVLGWVLTRAGRCAEGDRFATRSLRLGTRDALMLFHAGMAASCAGRSDVARERLTRALALNPAFSVRWAPVARAELAGLG